MHLAASVIATAFLLISTASCQVRHFAEPRLQQQTVRTPFVTRLNVQHQQQVPAFVITSIDQAWKEQSNAADPSEQRVPVLIGTKPGYARSQYRPQPHQPEPVPRPAASSPEVHEVRDEEQNDPRYNSYLMYDALSKQQYVVQYEPAPNATAPAGTEEPPATAAPTTTTTTTTEAPTTSAAPATTTTQAPAPKEEVLHTYPSYRSVASLPSHGENYVQTLPSPMAAYEPVAAMKGNPRKYVPSDVFTIEQSTNYRPRYFHSDAIFYQKALAFLRDYKESVLSNRQHGLNYRPNSETDDPTHVTNAYDELTPVLVPDREIPLVPHELLKPVHIAERPKAVTYDDQPAASAPEEKQLVGFLPVIALPKKSRYPPNQPYRLLSSLAAQESLVHSAIARQPAATAVPTAPVITAVPRRNPEANKRPVASAFPTITIAKPQQSYKLSDYEQHVPFLRVVRKQ